MMLPTKPTSGREQTSGLPVPWRIELEDFMTACLFSKWKLGVSVSGSKTSFVSFSMRANRAANSTTLTANFKLVWSA